MERVARLRGVQRRAGFGNTLERHGVEPGSWEAKQLAKAIGHLRRADGRFTRWSRQKTQASTGPPLDDGGDTTPAQQVTQLALRFNGATAR